MNYQLILSLVILPIVLGSFVAIDTLVVTANPWYPYFIKRLLNPILFLYFGLIAPAAIYWTQKVIYDASKNNVWSVNIIASVLLYGSGIIATYLIVGKAPSSKEIIALGLIFLITFWSRS